MPSAKHRASSRRAAAKRSAHTHTPSSKAHIAFFPLVILVLIVWVIYRTLFKDFPVWFDEILGKAIFFGLPVWLYLTMTGSRSMRDTFTVEKIKPGLLLGMAVGGIFGFAGIFATLLTRQVVLFAAPVFAAEGFWWEFFLAMMTGFWESLFFYTWMMTVIQEKFTKWPFLNQAILLSVIFLLFHIPNMILRFPLTAIPGQMVLLYFFALGQAFLFARSKNLYALALSHAIWGMVLLVHTR